jgi:hypothetical protein
VKDFIPLILTSPYISKYECNRYNEGWGGGREREREGGREGGRERAVKALKCLQYGLPHTVIYLRDI